MAYLEGITTVTITCDKCLYSRTVNNSDGKGDDRVFRAGFILRTKARKYEHLCYQCQTPAQQEATDFMLTKFRPARELQ